MFVRITKKNNGSSSVRIVESTREGDKVLQKTIRTIGQYKDVQEIELAKQFAENLIVKIKNNQNKSLPGFEDIVHKPKSKKSEDENFVNINKMNELERINYGINTVCGAIFNDLTFDKVIEGSKWNEILKAIVLQRVANPSSKMKTQRNLLRDFEKLIPLHSIYRMMDRVNEDTVKNVVKNSTFSMFEKVDILCFDVTTLYFESFVKDELKSPGFSKDNKFKESQVVLAMVTNSEGHPITYELFPGNTYEGSTLIKIIEQLSEKWEIKNVILVADRGMFNEANLAVMEEKNINFVVAAKLKSLKTEMKEKILTDIYTPSVIDDSLIWYKEYSHNNRRLIVSYSSKRAKKDQYDRQRLVERIQKKLQNKKTKISDLVPNHGTKKYLEIIDSGEAQISEEKINSDARWDGLHGVISNLKEWETTQILSRYKNLWRIEEAFRVNKHDLKMRPIFHWTEKRIRAHIAICFLAYALYYATLKKIKQNDIPISFEQMREELLHDEFSLFEDTSSNRMYQMFSKPTPLLQKIYKALNLKRPTGTKIYN
jgi:transposase